MALGQASSMFLGSRVRVGTEFPLVCTYCVVLGSDARTLGPSGFVRRPGAGAHSGGARSL